MTFILHRKRPTSTSHLLSEGSEIQMRRQSSAQTWGQRGGLLQVVTPKTSEGTLTSKADLELSELVGGAWEANDL